MIGILASMFSAIVITRIIFDIMLERGSKVSFG
jgi:preprotein translocase subunit SecD